jgi:hypothetical protein
VGVVTREREDAKLKGDEMKALTESFRIAYIEGRLRDPSLEGVLGGDFIHRWPPAAPLCWVQNWRDGNTETPNSWGIPSLVLAIRRTQGGQTFIVRGDILNTYGKSAGRKGANGVAGYGAPLGEEFLYKNGIAQRFEYGLMYVDPAGKGSVIPGTAPSAQETPGYVSGDDGIIPGDFREAWKRGMNSGLPGLNADGPVQRFDFSGTPWKIPVDTGMISITAIYYQSFNQEHVLFLLAQSPEEEFHTRIITAPFLPAFLAGRDQPLPGADAPLLFIPLTGTSGVFSETVLQGLARYGLPLTDAVPDREEGIRQRFSQGWMALKPE